MQVISISCNHWCSTHKPPRCSTRSLCGASIVKNRNFIQTVSISRIFLIFFQFSEFKQSHVILQSFGISIVFVATRSGLLRWRDVVPVEEQLLDDFGYVLQLFSTFKILDTWMLTFSIFRRPFYETNAKSNDQVWYKRAVDQYEEDPDSFVYSIPFDAGKFLKSQPFKKLKVHQGSFFFRNSERQSGHSFTRNFRGKRWVPSTSSRCWSSVQK